MFDKVLVIMMIALLLIVTALFIKQAYFVVLFCTFKMRWWPSQRMCLA